MLASLNARMLVLSIVTSAVLTACSGTGVVRLSSTPRTSAITPAPPPAAAAMGTLTIIVPQRATEGTRKPAYISTATMRAALFIDGLTIAYTTTTGTHIFRAEIANGSSAILAAGSKSVTIVPGSGNNFTITLNGAAAIASWVSTTSTTTNSISGSYAIEDDSSFPITSAPAAASTTFDNALMAVSGSPFATGTRPYQVVATANGSFLYVANNGSATVSAFTINASTGALTAVSGSPFAAGPNPWGI